MIIEEYCMDNRRSAARMCRGCCHFGLGLLPVLLAVCMSLTFITTYVIAVAYNHVYPYLPTISDTGGKKPESNYFGVLLSLCSFLAFLVMWTRFVQFRHISEYNEEEHSKLLFLNKLSFAVGILACIGAIVVAGFQDRGRSVYGHYAGALAVFGGGAIYTWFNTFLSHRILQCGMNSKRLCIVRAIMAFLVTFFLAMFLIFFYKSNQLFDNGTKFEKWCPKDPGYSYHVIASSCEWLCMMSLLFYFLTFTPEFNRIKINFSVERYEYLNILPFQTSTDESQPLVYA